MPLLSLHAATLLVTSTTDGAAPPAGSLRSQIALVQNNTARGANGADGNAGSAVAEGGKPGTGGVANAGTLVMTNSTLATDVSVKRRR